MRIKKFRVENYKNIRLAECENVPEFMVICGPNGCGKSALLEAIMELKESLGNYSGYRANLEAISADADEALISMTVLTTKDERDYVHSATGNELPSEFEVSLKLIKNPQGSRPTGSSVAINSLMGTFSESHPNSLGFFDYFDAYRLFPKRKVQQWEPTKVDANSIKPTLSSPGNKKFQFTKEYLVNLHIQNLSEKEIEDATGEKAFQDRFKDIRRVFGDIFSPMKFRGVITHKKPFEILITTPNGNIDIDELSSGEKEILNTYIRFHQFSPKSAVVLFDEADAHLHPDLQKKYLALLREVGTDNQFILTSHSPVMMLEAGSESLFKLMKTPVGEGKNQLIRVTESEQLHDALFDVMGNCGVVSFNRKVVFIEGEDSSTDRDIYETAYPQSQHNITYISAGNSATVRKVAERVNELLKESNEFQTYYCIIDGDLDRLESDPTGGKRLFQLPVYHVENLLLDSNIILQVAKELLVARKCPYNSDEEVRTELHKLLLDEHHLEAFSRAYISKKLGMYLRKLERAIVTDDDLSEIISLKPSEAGLRQEAKGLVEGSIQSGNWNKVCKGRELIKAFCSKNSISYKEFRNALISRVMKEPPTELTEIMNKILSD